MDAPGSLLVILSGRDRPGVTASLFQALSQHPVTVVDIEQLVVRGRLILAVLLGVDSTDVSQARTSVHQVATALGLEVESVPGAAPRPSAVGPRLDITLLGAPHVDDVGARLGPEVVDPSRAILGPGHRLVRADTRRHAVQQVIVPPQM